MSVDYENVEVLVTVMKTKSQSKDV